MKNKYEPTCQPNPNYPATCFELIWVNSMVFFSWTHSKGLFEQTILNLTQSNI